MHPRFRSGAGVDLPRVAYSPPFSHKQMVPPLVGGVPVDYGPRLVESRQPPTNFPFKSSPSNVNDEENAPSRLLWVGNISADTSEAILTQVFEKYGKVDTVSVYPQRSYAFVEFKALENAKAAKAGLQGKAVKGQPLRIEFSKPAKPSRRLWIWGANDTITKEQFETELKKFGSLEDFKILRDGKCALVVYKRLEDAIAAKEGFNKKTVRGQELRVDFLRSQPLKKGNTGVELKPQSVVIDEVGRREVVPSETLWISFPSSIRVDEERLRRAFILFGEVERIKTFPDRNYCFVQFRNADEASCAREGLQGRLFNDPRVQIQFSNNEGSSVGADRGDGSYLSPLRGREGLLHPGLSGLRTTLNAIERFGTDSHKISMNLPGQSSILHQEMGNNGSLMGLARQGGGVPTSAFVSRPLVRAGLADGRFLSEGANVHIDGLAMPLADFGSPKDRLPARPMGESQAIPDKDYMQRDSKRSKVGFSNSSGLLGRASLIDGHGLSRDVHENIQRYGKVGNEELQIQPGRLHPGPSTMDGVQPGIGVLGPGYGVLGPGHSRFVPNAGILDQTKGQDMTDAKWKWRGSIAKAGTFVCRAQSFSVGRGIDVELPEVVNCAARTTLDMLAQHLLQVVDYGVIVFVPDGDSENASYQDFVHYLGDKNRAGVANLGEKVTLFLVPPSHFSEKVLKLPGECLFGVLIKANEVGSANYHHLQGVLPQEQPNLQQFTQPLFKPTMEDNFAGNLKPSFTSPVNSLTPSSQSTSVPLTSNLISSLASTSPAQRHSPNNFLGGLHLSDAANNISGLATQIEQPGAAQSKGVAQAESRPAIKSVEIPLGNQIPPQLLGAGLVATAGFTDLISQPLSRISHQQPIGMLPNLIPDVDAQKYVSHVSGICDAAAGLSGMPELHTKDLNQSSTPLSQQSQGFEVQQHSQNIQQQITSNPQLLPQNTIQGGQPESSMLGQLSLGQFLQNSSSNGMVSVQGAVVGQVSEPNLPQVGGSAGSDRHNRFQATLQLAAALLQRMQNTSRSQDAPSQ